MFKRLLTFSQQAINVAAALIVVGVLSSCIPNKRLTLIQDKDDDGKKVFEALEHITDKYILQTNDYLYIRIVSPDAKLNEIFNPMSSGSGNSTQNQKFQYYVVDDQMSVEFPVIGKIDLSGCNLEAARVKITEAVGNYTDDFTVVVKLASNSFTVLGEFGSQGVKSMDRDQITIYDALAMSGGFTVYAKRSEVQLLRKNAAGEVCIYTMDLTDDAVINSDLYYIYPNDVLYVRAMKCKMFGIGETFSLSMLTSIITFCLLIISLI